MALISIDLQQYTRQNGTSTSPKALLGTLPYLCAEDDIRLGIYSLRPRGAGHDRVEPEPLLRVTH
jgi:hypothetical protein